jgi:hypothetical protein
MHYKSQFCDIVYVDDSGQPCALQYRIAVTKTSPRRVVLELVQDHDAFQSPGASDGVRDAVLNRIADHHLHGVRVDKLVLVVTDGSCVFHANRAAVPQESERAIHVKASA